LKRKHFKMSLSGVMVKDECVTAFEELQANQKYQFIIYRLSEDKKSIELEHCEDQTIEKYAKDVTNETHWKTFYDYLQKIQKEKDCRFATYDFRYETSEGSSRNKIAFLLFCPEDAHVKKRMLYASSKDALKLKLGKGIKEDIQAGDMDSVTLQEFREKCLRSTTYK